MNAQSQHILKPSTAAWNNLLQQANNTAALRKHAPPPFKRHRNNPPFVIPATVPVTAFPLHSLIMP